MTALVLRKALADYARRPFNLVLLVAVPAVMVLALAGELASFSKLLSAGAKPEHLEVATAGWAAAAVAGLAGFFQVVGSRTTDRRLASVSAHGARPVVAGRLLAAAVLAGAAAAAALIALALRGGIADPARAIPAVAVVAVIYVAIGVLVGTFTRSEMNGALVVTVIWMLDVFVGAGLGGGSALINRFFPLHFPTMVLTSQAAHHGGPISDVGWTLIWAGGLALIAVARLGAITRPARHARHAPALVLALSAPRSLPTTTPPITDTTPQPVSVQPRSVAVQTSVPASAVGRRAIPASRFAAALRAAMRDYRRNRVLWVLLLVVPVFFIALAAEQTPTTLMPVALLDGARHFTTMHSLRLIHAAQMASIASALLAGVAGLFVVTGSADGDRRLVLAGYRPREVLAAHLGVIAVAAVVITAVSLSVSAVFLSPHLWVEYAGADLLIALTYAMLGVLLGPLVGRLGGLYSLLLLSMVDVGYGQTVMFKPVPPTWGAFLPARGAGGLLLDGAFTTSFEQYGHLLLAFAWLAALTAAAALTFRHQTGAKLHRHTHTNPAVSRVGTAISLSPPDSVERAVAAHKNAQPGGNEVEEERAPVRGERSGEPAPSTSRGAQR